MEIREKIIAVTNLFGMKAEVAAKAMNVTIGTYRKKLSLRVDNHSFNQKNLIDLINYINQEADNIKKLLDF